MALVMSEFPVADELVTRRVLRAELAQLEKRLTLRIGAAIVAHTAILGTLIALS